MNKNITLIILLSLTTPQDIRLSITKIIHKSLENLLTNNPKILPQQKMSLKIFDKQNQYRNSKNLEELKWNSDIYILSLEHSYTQAISKKINHENFSERLENFRFKNENVAFFSSFGIGNGEGAQRFFEMWRNSEGHDRNMRSKDVDNGAVAVVREGNRFYATMINVFV